MPIVYIENLSQHSDQEVSVRGWLRHKRIGGKIAFLVLRDGTGDVQAVVSKAVVAEEIFSQVTKLTQESSLIVTGQVRADARAPGGFELDVKNIQVVQLVTEEFPIQAKEHGTGFLMENRHLWLRSHRQHAVLRIRHEIIKASRNFFDERGFVLVDTPIFTPNACEGTTTLFETDYFGERAYLTQSGQLYNEATAAAFGKVYCFGPTFRAEKSKTRRHLMEFWMIEPEVAFAKLEDMMILAEEFLSFIVVSVLKTRREELKVLERDVQRLEAVTPPFPRLTYGEAVERLRKHGNPIQPGDDFGGDEETILSNEFDRPAIIHRYPKSIKAFYMEEDPQNSDLSLCMDVLAPQGYGEIIGGGQRIHDHGRLKERLKEHHLSEESFKWYLDLRTFGSVPHAGFGMGIERAVAWICGLEHVRETIAFPRMLYRIYP
jgi:asparaginyl-tRNA synthetase